MSNALRLRPSIGRIGSVLLGSLISACVVPAGDALPSASPVSRSAAEIQVEAYRGLSAGNLPKQRTYALVDVTPMSYPDARPTDQAVLARQADTMIERLSIGLPDQPKPTTYPFLRDGAAVDTPSCPTDAAKQTHATVALSQLRGILDGRDMIDGAHIWLVTDLTRECAPSLCSTVEDLVERGAWLDFVQVGTDGEPPTCLRDLRPSPRQPTSLAPVDATSPPSFRVEAVTAGGETPVLARGTARGSPVEVGPGYRTIVVELSPEERIGPVEVRQGQRLRVVLMDFPLSAPRAREWRIEVENAR